MSGRAFAAAAAGAAAVGVLLGAAADPVVGVLLGATALVAALLVWLVG